MLAPARALGSPRASALSRTPCMTALPSPRYGRTLPSAARSLVSLAARVWHLAPSLLRALRLLYCCCEGLDLLCCRFLACRRLLLFFWKQDSSLRGCLLSRITPTASRFLPPSPRFLRCKKRCNYLRGWKSDCKEGKVVQHHTGAQYASCRPIG